MKERTNDDRRRLLSHLVAKHEEKLAEHRRVVAAAGHANDVLRATGYAARVAAELAELQAARAAIEGNDDE